jgi:hypothetical protein
VIGINKVSQKTGAIQFHNTIPAATLSPMGTVANKEQFVNGAKIAQSKSKVAKHAVHEGGQ